MCFKSKKRAFVVGSPQISDPFEPGCRLGPLVNEQQYHKVLSYVRAGLDGGATLLTGGRRPPHLKSGYFLEPTVFVDVAPANAIWREEIFGPVLSCQTFKTENEAIALANGSEFGLGAGVISKDLARCRRVQEALQVGICWINCSQPCFCQAPWGGVKNSGFGRELGPFGFEAFLSVKQVTSYTSNDKWDWYPDNPPAKM